VQLLLLQYRLLTDFNNFSPLQSEMISAHLTFTALPHYLTKFVHLNINSSYILHRSTVRSIWASQHVTKQAIHGQYDWVHVVCSEWPPLLQTGGRSLFTMRRYA